LHEVVQLVDHAAGKFKQVIFEDVASNPTLPRTKSVRCAACAHGEAAVFFLPCYHHGSSF
ncbi:hypothetical protein BAE44_0004849, partial [Dichanthelium oligosanthes]